MKNFKPFTAGEVALSIQHMFAMFGATVLVPILTGMSTSVALLTAGLGTLLFHVLTKMKVPVFLGSSFAFIPAVAAVVASDSVPVAQGGIIAAGCVYVALAVLVYFIGVDRIKKALPPVVTGPVIIVIGISLASVAINDASGIYTDAPTWLSWLVALCVISVVIFCMIKAKGFFKLVPILIGLAAGYVLCAVLGLFDLYPMTYQAVSDAPWINIPYVTEGFLSLPQFKMSAILAIAPIALVTFMEHIGDITTNSMVVGQNFMKDPGLHRTVLGDGLATALAGFFGGPANTTYSENTGVLATTKNYNPRILRLTAVFAIILGFFGKFGAVLQTIPDPVKGGVEIILFGMIAAIGIRTLAESKLDFTHSRNLVIVALILVLGLGIGAAGGITIGSFNLSGLFVATVAGIVANLILPQTSEEESGEKKTEGEKEEAVANEQ